MNSLEKYMLEAFCEKHGIDLHEIDNTLAYVENMEHLSKFTVRSLEDSAKDWKSLRGWFNSLSLGERYGDIKLPDKMPLLIIGCLVRYSQRMTSIVKLRLKPYRKHVDMRNKGYLIIRGQISEICEILQKIEDVSHRVLKKWLVYNWERLKANGNTCQPKAGCENRFS